MRYLLALTIALVIPVIGSGQPCAETINIVAFGDSNVFGMGQGRTPGGVPVSQAYPAKLEHALRARGWDVSVTNQGMPGASARDSIYNLDAHVPSTTKLTIVQFGGNDRSLLGASPVDIASYLSEIVRKIRAKGSAVILVRQWSPDDAAAFSEVTQNATAFVTWYAGLYSGRRPLPEYDSGDGSHLNAAGTDVVVARALPDVERVLTQIGFRPSR